MKLSTILGSAAVFLAEADHVTAQHWFSSCSGTFFIVEQRWMVAQCQTTYNTMRWSKLDLNPCISNFNGNLFKTNGVVPGGYADSCVECGMQAPFHMSCRCKDRDGNLKSYFSTINLNEFVSNQDGWLECYGHWSQPL